MHADTPSPDRRGAAPLLVALALGVPVAALLPGCRGDRSEAPPRQFIPDMDDQPKWKNQAGSDFFADGRTMRPSLPGTVPFGRSEVVSEEQWANEAHAQRDLMLKEDDAIYRGLNAEGAPLDTIPLEVTDRLIARGQERFNIYCVVCHGYMGDGKGMVGQKWSYPLPTFHDPKYYDRAQQTGKDGYIFHVIRNGVIGPDGVQKMPSYAHAVNEYDAWAIVSYFRALQASRTGTIEDVPVAERARLLEQRPVAPPPPPAAPNVTTPEPAQNPNQAPSPSPDTNPPTPPPTGGPQ